GPPINYGSLANALTHTYTTFGTYTITVQLYNPNPGIICINGQEEQQLPSSMVTIGTIEVIIDENCCPDNEINTYARNNCVGEVQHFTAQNYAGISVSWDFGDGSSSTSLNPDHTYSNPGNYTVTLTTSGPSSCSDTTSIVVPI